MLLGSSPPTMDPNLNPTPALGQGRAAASSSAAATHRGERPQFRTARTLREPQNPARYRWSRSQPRKAAAGSISLQHTKTAAQKPLADARRDLILPLLRARPRGRRSTRLLLRDGRFTAFAFPTDASFLSDKGCVFQPPLPAKLSCSPLPSLFGI